MMPHAYEQELRVALDAVQLAARVCQAVQAGLTPDVLKKRDRSPVTVADFSSQAVICRALADQFPDDAIIAEEDSAALKQAENSRFLGQIRKELGRIDIDADERTICSWIDRGGASSYCERFWTVDPIDGTKGFLRGEQYAISLALIVDAQIRVTLLGCPNLSMAPQGETPQAEPTNGALFYAVLGNGSHVVPLDASALPTRLDVTHNEEASKARFCESVESGHTAHDRSAAVATALGIAQPPVRLDSQAKYAVVARGEADVYLRLPTRPDYNEKIWDHAGGVLLVQEAGGTVSDVTGKPLDFSHGCELLNNRGVVVSNGRLHDAVLRALRQAGVA